VSSTKMDIDDHLMTILVDERDIKLCSEVKDSASVILLKDLQQHEQTKKVKNLIKKFLAKTMHLPYHQYRLLTKTKTRPWKILYRLVKNLFERQDTDTSASSLVKFFMSTNSELDLW